MLNDEIDIKKALNFDDKELRNRVKNTEKHLKEFYQIISKKINQPAFSFIVLHKAYNLLLPGLSQQNFGFILPIKEGGCICNIKPPDDCNIYIIVDSIDDGDEIKNVLQSLSEYRDRIKEIFSFISNEKGVKSLNENKQFGLSNITSWRTMSGEAYKNFYKDYVLAYLSSLVEPMDTDHPYITYSLSGDKISVESIREIIEECISDTLKTKVKLEEDKLSTCYIQSFSASFLDEEAQKLINSPNKGANLEQITIRARVKMPKENKTRFSITVYCGFNITLNSLECSSEIPCLKKKVYYSAINEPEIILCSYCLSSFYSSNLLNNLERQISESLKRLAFCSKKEKYVNLWCGSN